MSAASRATMAPGPALRHQKTLYAPSLGSHSGVLPVPRLAIALILLAFAFLPALNARAAEPACRTLTFESAGHIVCTYDLAETELKLFWRDADGRAFRSLRTFAGSSAGQNAVFAMNAGMYQRDGAPLGLYVENGTEFRPAITGNGPGNFHMKPNGVFYIAGGKAGVMETAAYVRSETKADIATQSGPMLVIDGALHPRFIPGSDSRKIRNGVGVSADGRTVTFVLSTDRVNFETFARFFRDELGIRDALYLDGTISSLYAPEVNRTDFFWPVGPIVAAFPKP